jgi:hypothetical protein
MRNPTLLHYMAAEGFYMRRTAGTGLAGRLTFCKRGVTAGRQRRKRQRQPDRQISDYGLCSRHVRDSKNRSRNRIRLRNSLYSIISRTSMGRKEFRYFYYRRDCANVPSSASLTLFQ